MMITEELRLYEDGKNVTLTTYVINEKGELAGQGARPAILICPGGGYFNCSDREAEPVALKFASMGYHAFVLRYSTYTEGENMLPDISKKIPVKESTKYPQPMRDIGKAMCLIREKSEEWNVDMKRVAVCGFSAGAHNTAMYGVYYNNPIITDYLGVTAEEIRPAAMILGYMLSDYVFMKSVEKNEMDEAFFNNSNIAFIGTDSPDDEMLRTVSPAMQVTDATPPAFLWATAGDNMVPVQHSLRMAHALADAKIPFEIHVFEEGDHGLSVATQASSVAQSQMNRDAAQWMKQADEWLMKRFALKLPAKTPFEEMMDNK